MRQDLVDTLVASWTEELPEVVSTEFELVKRVARLHALLAEVLIAQLNRFGITKAEYDVLCALAAAGEPYRLKPSELAARILLSSGGTSNVLRRLAGAGLVDREPDPSDARSSWVVLTPEGVELTHAAVREGSRAQAELLAPAAGPATRTAADALREVLLGVGDEVVAQPSVRVAR
ncbi:MarR family transcriptional regulator [Amycolatopsis rhabdoformis]|uniref:MarR family transcriptional regulator n=1 Tax=Amycolatopsis rhabdoformis TaxID=1448059 RepID=A0ABZ1ILY8_9PSEU|nr:MarR family transcriptional regulator [Amycolatopsis rhabdoformis]WSE34703.1 MarR family transcriptional regulator [Amycolatopsis rhabdoformis]